MVDEGGAWKVLPNPDGGWYVAERTEYGFLPRGFTYPTQELAEAILPTVRDGNFYPTAEEIFDLKVYLRSTKAENIGPVRPRPESTNARRGG